MKGLLPAPLLLLSLASHADEMRVGSLHVPWPEQCVSQRQPRTIEVTCPGGETVLITPILAKPGLAQAQAEAQFLETAQDISRRIMAPAAAKCGEVLGGVKRSTVNNAVVYSTASRCRRKRKEYYFLQYAVAGSGGLIFFTIEGFGNSAEQSARFDALFQGARFDIPEVTGAKPGQAFEPKTLRGST